MNVEVGPLFATLILLALIGGTAAVFKLARRFPELSYGLFLFYAVVSIFISLLYLETHAVFIAEASATSEAIGAAVRFAVLNGAMLAGILAAFYRRKPARGIAVPTRLEVELTTHILAAVIGAQFLNLMLSSSTAFPWGRATRFNYWTDYAFLPLLQDLFGTFSIFVPFTASALYVYSVENGWIFTKRASLAFLALYFIYLLGTGQVFHGHLVPVTILVGTYLIWKTVRRQRVISIKATGLLAAFALVASLLAVSSLGQREIGRGGGAQATMYRLLVVQGGVIWRADDIRQRGFQGSVNHLLEGRTFLLRTILPPSLADQYEEKGVNLQGALPSTAYLAVGFFRALLICFLYGLLCGAVMRLMTWLFLTGQLLLMFVASYLWLWAIVAYSRASLETILTPSFGLAVVIVIAWVALKPLPLGKVRPTRPARDAPYYRSETKKLKRWGLAVRRGR